MNHRKKLLAKYREYGQLDMIRLIDLLNSDSDGKLIWHLIVEFRQDVLGLFISVIDVSFEVALREIRRVSGVLQEGFHIWNDYDAIAYWAIDIIKSRKNENDEINIEAARIIEYVASNVGRFRIKDASNILKGDATIDGHIRAQLS